MSRKETKQQTIDRLLAELKAQQEINAQLANVLKMTEDGQWVVISEKDLNRYRNGIDALLKAGDALMKTISEDGLDVIGDLENREKAQQLWNDAKTSDKF
jgi:parvulin-like peptidyl-prolyl isomerase